MSNTSLVQTLVVVVASMIVVGLFAALRRRLTRNAIDMLRFDPPEAALDAMLVLLAAVWTLVARYIIIRTGDVPPVNIVAVSGLVFFPSLSLGDVLLCIAGVLSMAALEEVIFRGLLLGFFVSRRWTAVGVIVSSLLFAVSHAGEALVQAGFFFLAGMTFSSIAIRSGLVAAIVVHALYNLPRAFESRLFIDGLDLVDPFTRHISRSDAEFYVLLLCVPFALYVAVRGLSMWRGTRTPGHVAA